MENSHVKIMTETSPASVLVDDNSSSASSDVGYKFSLIEDTDCESSSILTSSNVDTETTEAVNNNFQIVHDIQESKKDEILSSTKEPCLVNDIELLDPISDINVPLKGTALDKSKLIAVEIGGIEHDRIVVEIIGLEERNIRRKLSEDDQKIPPKLNEECPNEPLIKASEFDLQLPGKKDQNKNGLKSVFELDCVPLWGSASVRGHRPEMEDAFMALPHFTTIPIKMFIGDQIDELRLSLTHLTSHFFGVYDGHGGSQVANYCRDRIHSALIEELSDLKEHLSNESSIDTRQGQWEKLFTNCFSKVDDEISGKSSIGTSKSDETTYDNCTIQPIAPETVGSTAVVSVVCSSHIIVANCGDSRAVLYRGKEAIPLSVDHKPNREDECARIENLGGKVIDWNGHRVCGILAMSRAIGDRCLKPYIIPEPEVTFIARAREDECLILASDGLWDVMTNEEACEVARKRILIWHKKNGTNPLVNRGQSVDPAAQSAAEFLSNLAIQNGSKDNVSVIVVDLKARRKIKNNTSSCPV